MMGDIIIAICAGWLATLSGVALGGWLVYRTKRESHEGLWSAKPPEGDAFNIIDDEQSEHMQSSASLPRAVESANEAFINQFVEGLADATTKTR